MNIRLLHSIAFVLLVVPRSAHASLFGEENGPLTTLVAQGIAEAVQAAETMREIVATYEETKKYVGMAQDAIDGFQEFGAYADSVFSDPRNALAAVLPETQGFDKSIKSPESWGKGTGELQRLITVCLGGGDCAAFQEAVTAKKARDAITKTFGTSPIQRDDLDAVDVESARAIHAGMVQTGNAAVAAEQAQALMKKCLDGTNNEAVAACQAAANLGQLMQVEQTAALNEQMAEANRLKATEMAAANGEKKRELKENLDRQKMLRAGAKHMAPPQVRFSTESLGQEGLR